MSNQTDVERQKRRERVKDFVLRGVTNLNQISAALGVGYQAIKNDVEFILENWVRDSIKTSRRKAAKLQEMWLFSAHESITAWERSKQQAETVTIDYLKRKCPDCKGTGFQQDQETWCESCKGDGTITSERINRRVTGQSGAPAHMANYQKALENVGKLSGVYSKETKVQNKSTLQVQINDNRQVNLSNAPAGLLLDAKAAMFRLLQSQESVQEEISVEANKENGK